MSLGDLREYGVSLLLVVLDADITGTEAKLQII